MSADIARRLRRDMTGAEKVVWRLLRSRQLGGYKFRRQEPIGRLENADSVCARIMECLAAAPPRPPSPARGRGMGRRP